MSIRNGNANNISKQWLERLWDRLEQGLQGFGMERHLCLSQHLLDPPPVRGVRGKHSGCCLHFVTRHTRYVSYFISVTRIFSYLLHFFITFCHTSHKICHIFYICHTIHHITCLHSSSPNSLLGARLLLLLRLVPVHTHFTLLLFKNSRDNRI